MVLRIFLLKLLKAAPFFEIIRIKSKEEWDIEGNTKKIQV